MRRGATLGVTLMLGILGSFWSTGIEAQTMDNMYLTSPDEPTLLMYLQSVSLKITSSEPNNGPWVIRYTGKDITVTAKVDVEGSSVIDLSFVGPKEAETLTVDSFSLRILIKKIHNDYWTVTKYNASIQGKAKNDVISFKDTPMTSNMEFGAPKGMSFHCNRYGSIYQIGVANPTPATGTNATYSPSIDFFNLQFQALMTDNSKFGPSQDCVGFFTEGILSGIFITLILLGILTWGITMIMNVSTMDRFDDPKGKVILVGAND